MNSASFLFVFDDHCFVFLSTSHPLKRSKVSTPFLHLRWYLVRPCGLGGTKPARVVTAIYLVLYFVARIVFCLPVLWYAACLVVPLLHCLHLFCKSHRKCVRLHISLAALYCAPSLWLSVVKRGFGN